MAYDETSTVLERLERRAVLIRDFLRSLLGMLEGIDGNADLVNEILREAGRAHEAADWMIEQLDLIEQGTLQGQINLAFTRQR